MFASTVAVSGALAYQFPALLPVLAEHLDDYNNEILPHLFVSDVLRWVVEHRTDAEETAHAILDLLGEAFVRGDEDVRDLIAVSGVEMLPDPGLPGSELREWLRPELREVDPWRNQ